MAPETTTRIRPGRLLGDVIVSLGFCDRDTVEDVVREARTAGRPMGQILLEQGLIGSDQLAIAIAERFGLQYASLQTLVPDLAAMHLVSPAALRRLQAVPVGLRDNEIPARRDGQSLQRPRAACRRTVARASRSTAGASTSA